MQGNCIQLELLDFKISFMLNRPALSAFKSYIMWGKWPGSLSPRQSSLECWSYNTGKLSSRSSRAVSALHVGEIKRLSPGPKNTSKRPKAVWAAAQVTDSHTRVCATTTQVYGCLHVDANACDCVCVGAGGRGLLLKSCLRRGVSVVNLWGGAERMAGSLCATDPSWDLELEPFSTAQRDDCVPSPTQYSIRAAPGTDDRGGRRQGGAMKSRVQKIGHGNDKLTGVFWCSKISRHEGLTNKICPFFFSFL